MKAGFLNPVSYAGKPTTPNYAVRDLLPILLEPNVHVQGGSECEGCAKDRP
jgi:hypothetical protein